MLLIMLSGLPKFTQTTKVIKMDAKGVVKKVINTALIPAEKVLQVANSIDKRIHQSTDEAKTIYGQAVPYKSNKGTQPDHHVTDNNNHTKPASKMESAKRPAVGADVDAKKKYGSKSWNNGYTN